jgi:membrane-bound serine protease (ClpP class)
MTRVFFTLLAAMMFPIFIGAQDAAPVGMAELEAPAAGGPKTVMVIPVREAIDKPILYVLRRGLKEAIDKNIDVVVLDMKTPGGRLDVTFDIMEALEKFPGERITFVNDQAISAGAFISAVTDDIWFAPRGKIGAAAPVTGSGEDVDVTMKQKIVSFLKAEVRSVSEGKGHRGQVISAMIDADFELKIGDEVLKPKGELLTLTATEAAKNYGDPAIPLLAAGIAKDIDDLFTQKYGAGNFTVTRLEVTWSEELAQYLNTLSPILMGLGLLAVFIEFKTPGFGFFGITGGVLLGVVFFGHYVAGLSGHEPALIFALGVVLVFIELFFFPGVVVAALTGVLLMLGALVWSMADLWPNEPIDLSGDMFTQPLLNMALGLLVAGGLAVVLARFLPRGWFWDRMILQAAIDTHSQASANDTAGTGTLIGRRGVTVTALMPSGQIEIDGRRYEARVDVGMIEVSVPVVVVRRSDFNLIVERADT